MTKEEFLNAVIDPITGKSNNYNILKHNIDVQNFCNENYPGKTVHEAAYMIKNHIAEQPICKNKNCFRPTSFRSLHKGYQQYCCEKCAAEDIQTEINANDKENITPEMVVDEFVNKETGKIIKQKCVTYCLVKHGWYNPLLKLYPDAENCAEAIYMAANGLIEKPRCVVCGRPLAFHHGYATHCDRDCVSQDEELNARMAVSVSKALKKAYQEKGDKILAKRAATIYKRYGVYSPTPFAVPEVQKKCVENTHNIHFSSIEKRVQSILEKHDISYRDHDRTQIYPKELDFYLPDYKIGIECNGAHWHKGLESKEKHIEKQKLCRKAGILLVYLWDNEIILKPDQVEAELMSLIAKYVSDDIRPVPKEEAVKFIADNTIQRIKKANAYLGQYVDDKLVSCVSFTGKKNRLSVQNVVGSYYILNKLNLNMEMESQYDLARFGMDKHRKGKDYSYMLNWQTFEIRELTDENLGRDYFERHDTGFYRYRKEIVRR